MNPDWEEPNQRNQALEADAYTDALTDLPNRRFYHERLTQEVARARRNARQLTLALVDLDHDRADHKAGDHVLKFFAQFLKANLRQDDVVCRLGGDEFTLLLPDTSAQTAKELLDKIRQKLDLIELSIDGRSRCVVSFSCGFASYHSGLLAEDIMEEADHSLFTAKSRGWNRAIATAAGEGEPMAQMAR